MFVVSNQYGVVASKVLREWTVLASTGNVWLARKDLGLDGERGSLSDEEMFGILNWTRVKNVKMNGKRKRERERVGVE